MLQKLRDTRAEFLFSSSFKFLFWAIGLALVISVFSAILRAPTLHTIADESVRYIEERGQVDSVVTLELQRLQAASNLDCQYTIEADYISGSNKIQYGDLVAVTMKHTVYFGVGGIVKLPITLTARSEGRSERYWK